MTKQLQHRPGDELEVFERGGWVPCRIISIATYVGKSGPGYYAAYDPPREDCASFWCYDRVLRARNSEDSLRSENSGTAEYSSNAAPSEIAAVAKAIELEMAVMNGGAQFAHLYDGSSRVGKRLAGVAISALDRARHTRRPPRRLIGGLPT